jgi:hypothetical protein
MNNDRSENSKEHKMNKRYVAALIVLFLGLALVFATATVLAQGTSSTINWWVIAGGGEPIQSGNVSINDTLGQPVIGPSSGGNVSLTAGYWYGPVSEPSHIYYLPIILKASH